MIVDDEPDIVAVLKLALKEFSVVGFTSPKAAYDALKTNSEDFIILISDVRMPGMTGFELAGAALNISPEIRIILMTAFDISPEAYSKILPTGKIIKFLVKPFEMPTLRSIVKSLFTNNPSSKSQSNLPEEDSH